MVLGSDGSLLVAQDKDIGGDDALKLRKKSEVGPSLNSNSPCKLKMSKTPRIGRFMRSLWANGSLKKMQP